VGGLAGKLFTKTSSRLIGGLKIMDSVPGASFLWYIKIFLQKILKTLEAADAVKSSKRLRNHFIYHGWCFEGHHICFLVSLTERAHFSMQSAEETKKSTYWSSCLVHFLYTSKQLVNFQGRLFTKFYFFQGGLA